jgi:D-alanyl-D-alanine carboxypeptidase
MQPAASIGARLPPMRLNASECAIGAGIGQRTKRLPGWGLLFGAFQTETQARRHAEQMRARLRPVLKGGQIAVVRRQAEDNITWKALLVDLKQVDAINACLDLIKSSNVCLVQSPNVMNGGSGGTQVKLRKRQAQAAAPLPPPYF